MTLAVVYVCTGDYWRFWQGFRESAARYLVPELSVTYFVFSDQPVEHFAGADVVVPQDNLGWPLNTLYRFRMFLRISQRLQAFDRVLFFNANCEFHAPINSDELFGGTAGLVACRHPGFFDKQPEQFTYERRPQSRACLTQGSVYVAGGLMGGSTPSFLQACEVIQSHIEDDFDRGVLALWHDESHWNAYIDEQRAKGRHVHLLDPGFLYPEGWSIPFVPRIVLREKSAVIDVQRIKGQAKSPLGPAQLRQSPWRRLTRRLGISRSDSDA